MSAVLHPHGHVAGDHHDDHAHDHPHGWRRWLFATNHKDIGTMYLWFSFAMFMIGGINALALRTELFQPGLQFLRLRQACAARAFQCLRVRLCPATTPLRRLPAPTCAQRRLPWAGRCTRPCRYRWVPAWT